MAYTPERSTFMPRPRPEVFAFFADAHNLERITPDFLRFHILTPDPIVMNPGTLIDYEMRLHGIRVRWTTLIQVFKPDDPFVDVQLSGPYRSWRHRHDFADVLGGTGMHDRVDYEMPFWFLAAIVHRVFVKASLDRIFDYRNAAIAEYFQAEQ